MELEGINLKRYKFKKEKIDFKINKYKNNKTIII